MYPILCEDGKVYYGLTLLTFGKGVRKARPLCRLLNAALPAGSVLTFLIGAALLFWQNSDRVPVDNYSLLLFYALVIVSMFMHEAAHLIAAVAFGYPVSEAGVIFYLKIFPSCLYVGHGRKKNATKGEERRRSAISCRRTVGRPEHDLLRSSGNQHLHHHIQSCARQRNGRRRRGRTELPVRSKEHLYSCQEVYEKQKATPQANPLRRTVRYSLHACIALFRLILFTNEKYILWAGFIIFSPMVFIMLYCNA